ncbi:MAG: glucuronate isomerase [Rikenellaceae bacterium]
MSKKFINDDFLLESKYAKELYNKFSKIHPIINVKEIYEDKQFSTITEVWLYGDHYKWRLMRACGIDEKFITGDGDDYAKFLSFAKIMKKIIGNPIYHWSHLELKRYFGIDEILSEKTAATIYDKCNKLLQTKEFSVRNLLAGKNVKVLCTTDDPIDSLEYHKLLSKEETRFKVLPTWRPDKVMAIEDKNFVSYVTQLGELTDINIQTTANLTAALEKRMEHFKAHGCIIADHGLTKLYAKPYTTMQMDGALAKALQGTELSEDEIAIYKSGIICILLEMNHKAAFVQQIHEGAMRSQNSLLKDKLGADIGCDSLADYSTSEELGKILDTVNRKKHLAKTILYNLNPKDSEVMASMAYNFNDGSSAGKMQYGAAWWFLDNKVGIEHQLDVLSNFCAMGEFIGMLTDSRSFLSFTRHEYFRRILCNYVGGLIVKGEIPITELENVGEMVANISYFNIRKYLNL